MLVMSGIGLQVCQRKTQRLMCTAWVRHHKNAACWHNLCKASLSVSLGSRELNCCSMRAEQLSRPNNKLWKPISKIEIGSFHFIVLWLATMGAAFLLCRRSHPQTYPFDHGLRRVIILFPRYKAVTACLQGDTARLELEGMKSRPLPWGSSASRQARQPWSLGFVCRFSVCQWCGGAGQHQSHSPKSAGMCIL